MGVIHKHWIKKFSKAPWGVLVFKFTGETTDVIFKEEKLSIHIVY